MKRVGYWISEKKSKKLNFEEHRPLFRNAGIELVKIDLTQSLDTQGPFDAIVHKVTDILARADNGNLKARQYIHNIQSYKDRHPDCVLLDPLESTRHLLDRYKQYQRVRTCDLVCRDHRVIIPTFVELTTTDVEENKRKLAEAGVTFPIVVKPLLAHGSKMAHEMAIIFNKESLPRCGSSVCSPVLPEPQRSLEVSKPGSSHPLNEVDMESIDEPLIKPDWQLLEQLGAAISQAMDMTLLGIDVIIDSETQQYAIIDINAFPGFEGVDDFFSHLLDHILERLGTKDNCDNTTRTNPTTAVSSTTAAPSTTRNEALLMKEHEPTRSADAKTAAVNAANLKASQMFIMDQTCVIDCFSSHSCGNRSKVGVMGGEDTEKKPCFSQLRNKNSSPNAH
ncbi:hypothetical protein BaRGS_00037281 [Batillaria attramentaria]|uniref:Inositol-tetrakisphosphate 1-kinase n=1 Tax=Batillaria attramentaria TaxID=370345 RepID=A0ABD0J982_9CAEN